MHAGMTNTDKDSDKCFYQFCAVIAMSAGFSRYVIPVRTIRL